MKKTCNKCIIEKEINLFYKAKANKDGISSWCISCDKEKTRKYNRTKNGISNNIYTKQVSRSKKRQHSPPSYTRSQFKSWLFSNSSFDVIYDRWVDSKYDEKLTPSVDRLDDYKGYSFDNIQLITWQENKDKCYKDIKEGRNNKNSKSVDMMSKEGLFVKSYQSMAMASRENNIHRGSINEVCLGVRKTAGGYIWRYSL